MGNRRLDVRGARAVGIAVVLAGLAGAARAEEPSLEGRVEALRGRLAGWEASLDRLREQGQDVSYPLVTYTVIENFVGYAAEDLRARVPDNWGFTAVNGSRSRMEVAVGEGRGGGVGVRLVNESALLPNRYGMLECGQTLALGVGKTYTFSAWAKSRAAGGAKLVAGGGWQFAAEVPDTRGEWRRVEVTFVAGAGDAAFRPRVVTERETGGVVLDDFWVCEGSAAEAGKNLVANGSLEDGWTQRRAALAIKDMEGMAGRLDAEIGRAMKGERLPVVPRWTGEGRPKVEGVSFVGKTSAAQRAAAKSGEPIFFVGYGHFAQARNDIPKFPAYGVNVIQQEAGPALLYPAEGKVDPSLVERIRATLREGAKHGVAVDLLLSPHYFPGWMFAKYPELRKQRADFFPFSVYHPAVPGLMKKYVADLLGGIKDEPALLSVCLSNEPINVEEPSEFAAKSWHEWLERKHGDVARMNGAWGTSYKDFAAVPYPNPFENGRKPTPLWADWVRFNQEYFAAFHRMLADAVHAVAPGVPVHAKATTWHDWRSEDVRGGDDATLFAGFSDVMGNDSVNLWGFGADAPAEGPPERGSREWAQGWVEEALGYDLLRSAKDAPVFNSENHLIFDREQRWVSPDHVRAALWQGAVHGQSATTLWVWERAMDLGSDCAGSIMERPACAEALGRVCHDLNRVAGEMTAIQRKAPDVQILQSTSSATWDGAAGQEAMVQTYTALSFLGVKIGFITERQLEGGVGPAAPVVVVPGVRHLSLAAMKKLREYGGKVVVVGDEQGLTRDEYDKAVGVGLRGVERVGFVAGKTKWREVWEGLRAKVGTPKGVRVAGEKGEAIADVQWLQAGDVVNLYNPRPWTVRFRVEGARRGKDLLSGEESDFGKVVELRPMEVRLYRVE